MKLFLSGWILSTIFIAAASYADTPLPAKGWVVGKDYLAFWNTEKLTVDKKVMPVSHAFDSKSCQLWVSNPHTNSLQRFDPHQLTPAFRLQAKGRIVSAVSNEHFLFLNEANDKLEKRTLEGEVTASYDLADSDHLLRFHGGESPWGLFFDSKQNRIWMKSFTPEFKVGKELPIATASVIWANPRMLVNAKTRDVWVGYSTSAPGLSYSPHVNQYGPDGALISEFKWNKLGLFFDICEEGDRVFAARDLPTPPYTVPVTSYVDALVPGKGATPHYTAATNDFVDSLICQADSLWMVQRSIFGSQGSYLMTWKNGDQGTGSQVHKLPGSADQLYLCER